MSGLSVKDVQKEALSLSMTKKIPTRRIEFTHTKCLHDDVNNTRVINIGITI